MKRILFITSGSIGDAIISTGILGWLMDKHPDAKFTIAAGVASAPLFLDCPQLERLLPVKKLSFNRHWYFLWKATHKTTWDIIVDLRGSLLSYLVPCKARYVFSSPDSSLSKAEQLAALIKISPPPPPRLWVSESGRRNAAQLVSKSGYIVIAPKTNSEAKDWPIERFAALIQMINTETSRFVILATKEQQPSVVPLIHCLPQGHISDLCGRTDLPTAIAILEQAAMFIGNDSGLLHMAAALGIPSVGIYGPSNDKTYAPRGRHVAIVTSHEFKAGEPEKRNNSYMKKISVETVYNAIIALQNRASVQQST